jgi:hypothetical protein
MRPRRRQSPWGHHIVALAQGGILRDRIMRRQVVVTDACSVERRAVTKRSWQFGIGLSGSRYGAVNIVRSVRLSINGSFSIRAKISAEGFLFGRAGTHCYDQPCRLLCPSRMCSLLSWIVPTLRGTWRDYYVLSIEPTLFDDSSLVREWGRSLSLNSARASSRRRRGLGNCRTPSPMAVA